MRFLRQKAIYIQNGPVMPIEVMTEKNNQLSSVSKNSSQAPSGARTAMILTRP